MIHTFGVTVAVHPGPHILPLLLPLLLTPCRCSCPALLASCFTCSPAVQGVNPNLGRSGTKLDVKALIQVCGRH